MTLRKGFTLIELLIVLSILVLVASITIPKMVDVFERGRSSTQAYTLADVSRQLEVYFGLNHKYPEGFDLLMSAGSTNATEPSAIYTKLAPEIEAPNTFLTVSGALTTDQITSLKSAGIGHVFSNSETATVPSDSGVTRHHTGASGNGHDGSANANKFVIIDTTSGSDGLNLLINDFGLKPNIDASVTANARIDANLYVVLGVGPKCTLVQSLIQEAPLLEHANTSTAYSRALAVFEVPLTGGAKAKLVGVFGPDGRSRKVSTQDFNNVNGVQPH